MSDSPLIQCLIDPLIPEFEIKTIFLTLLDAGLFTLATKCLERLKTPDYGLVHQHRVPSSHDGLADEDLFLYAKKDGDELVVLSADVSPLLYAAASGRLDVVQYLCEHGADIEHQSIWHTTAIMFAFENGHVNVVKYLYEKGAKLISHNQEITEYYQREHRASYQELLVYTDSLIDNFDVWK